MFYRKTLIASTILASFSLSNNVYAVTFCGDNEYDYLGNQENITVGKGKCAEVSFWQDAQGVEFMTWKNIVVTNGALLNVAGNLYTATIDNKATLWIGKRPQIADEGYNKNLPALAQDITVTNGSLARVMNGGTIKDAIVLNDGKIFVSNQGKYYPAAKDADDPGIARSVEVRDKGSLYVYLGGEGFDTLIKDGGHENIQTKGLSYNSIVEKGGIQNIESGGIADGATVAGYQQVSIGKNANFGAGQSKNNNFIENGEQVLHGGGYAENTTFNDNALQNVLSTAHSHQTTFNQTSHGLVGSGGRMTGATTLNQNSYLSLLAGEDSKGAEHSGAYVEDLILNNKNLVYLVKNTNADDGVIFIDNVKGSGQFAFVGKKTEDDALGYTVLKIDNLSGSHIFSMNTSINEERGDYIRINKGAGSHGLIVNDSGVEIADPMSKTHDLVTDASQGATFDLVSQNNVNIDAVDGGTYKYYLKQRQDDGGKVWYLSADKYVKPIDPIDPVDPVDPIGPKPETTPSTDAIIAMSAAPNLIFQNELNNLRFRKGEFRASGDGNHVWARYNGAKDNVNSGYSHFKLSQSGLEIGADTAFVKESGIVHLGLFTSYTEANVKHKQGGKSDINSMSVGLYSSYFANNGLYLDGVLKYNYFDNSLRTTMSQGGSVSGDYEQHAVGGAFEAGYTKTYENALFVEPYGRLSYVHLNGKTAYLDNGMKGRVKGQDSFVGEVGIYAGKTYHMQGYTLQPYLKAAFAYEFIDNNETTINDINTFTNDLSGGQGRYGAGIDAKVSKSVNIYGEVNYANGSKVESPVQGNIGIRYTF